MTHPLPEPDPTARPAPTHPNTCPLCWTVRSASGACECDPDGAHPNQTPGGLRPVGPTVADVHAARAARRVQPNARLVDYAETLARTRRIVGCQLERDREVMCDRCTDDLAGLLRDVPAIVAEVNRSRVAAGESGVNLLHARSLPGDAERRRLDPAFMAPPLVGGSGATGARSDLRVVLRSLVVDCLDCHVIGTDVSMVIPPAGDLPAMSRWLLHRVDAMALHPYFHPAAWNLSEVIERALHVVDRRATRHDLGACTQPTPITPDDEDPTGEPLALDRADDAPPELCGGRVTALEGAAFAWCSRCKARVEAEPLRRAAMAEINDRLYTATEIGQLSRYLDLAATHTRVRDAVYQWAKRRFIYRDHGPWPEAGPTPPVYRFGDVHPLLLEAYGPPPDELDPRPDALAALARLIKETER